MMGIVLSYVFYLLSTWVCYAGCNMNVSEYNIPDEIYEMCSYADICHRKATLQPPAGYTSCCQSCSCEKDCGLTLNCCFDHLDKYRRVERGEVSCIKPTIGDKIQPRNYYMISSCNSINEIQRANPSACDLQDENGVNLLAPVSSAYGVYVNAKCAECNDDFDYKSWDYVHYAERSYNLVHIQLTFEHNAIGDSGTIEYIPPNSDKLSSPKLCYQPNASSYCSDNEILNFPLTCKNLQSVYFDSYEKTIHKNAACLLCNSSSNGDVLRQLCAQNTQLSSRDSFTVLINSEVLNALNFNNVFKPHANAPSTIICERGNIKSLQTGRCLSVYCPEGLIRTKRGCKYLFKRWYAEAIIMQMKLSADDRTPLLFSTIQRLPSQYISNPNIWMKPPCPGMKLIMIYYEQGNLTHVNSFIVIVLKEAYNGRGFSPSQMYPLLRSCLDNPWTVLIMNVTYTFTVKLDRYAGHIQNGIQPLRFVSDPSKEIDPEPKLYDKIVDQRYALLRRYRPLVIAIKTFFCNQIRLPEEEVELGYGEIRILANNKTLGTNEFTYSGSPALSPNFTCYICLEDYIPKSGVPNMNYVTYWFVTGSLVMFIMFCAQYKFLLGMKL